MIRFRVWLWEWVVGEGGRIRILEAEVKELRGLGIGRIVDVEIIKNFERGSVGERDSELGVEILKE